MASTVALGVSLGSETCVVAVSSSATPGRFEVVADDMGERATPFYVSYSTEEVLVGAAAKNAAVRKPKNTCHGILALVSAKASDDVQSLRLTCDVDDDEGEGGVTLPSVADCGDDGGDTARTPNDVLLEFLGRLSQLLSNAAGNSTIGSVVISVPRGTDSGAVLDAIHRSGAVPKTATLRVANDDTCIAATYRPEIFDVADAANSATDNAATATKVVAVLDWGANVLTCSLHRVYNSAVEHLTSKSSVGRVGGRQLDKALCNQIADAFQRKTRADPREEPRSMRKLALAVEKAKWALSVSANANVELEAFCNGADLNEPLSRAKVDMAFDSLGCVAVLDDLLGHAATFIAECGESIDAIVLSGGMLRMPRAQAVARAAIAKRFGAAAVVDRVPMDEVSAIGACMAAQSLPHGTSSWVDGDVETPSQALDLVCATTGDAPSITLLVPRGEHLPTARRINFGAALSAPSSIVLGVRGAEAGAAVQWIGAAQVPVGTTGLDLAIDESGVTTVKLIEAGSKKKQPPPVLTCAPSA